jgi:CHAT domain-containing protein
MSQADSELNSLISLAGLQDQAYSLLPRLSPRDGVIPVEVFDEFLTKMRQLLQDGSQHERNWPGTYDVRPAAGILVQQLRIYADYVAAQGDRTRALALRAEAQRLSDHYLDMTAVAESARGLALNDLAEGQFHQALNRLDEAYRAFSSEGRTLQAVHTLLTLANAYEWLCDYERALTVLNDAETVLTSELPGGPPSQADIAGSALDALQLQIVHSELLQGRARVNRWLGNLDEAERLLKQVRPQVAQDLRSGIDYHLAVVALRQGRIDEAEQLLQVIEPAFDVGLARSRRAAWLLASADVALERAQPSRALDLISDALSDQDRYPDLDLAWRLRWRKARAQSATGRHREAVETYVEAVNAIDRLRFAPLGYVLDTTFLRDKLPLVHAAIDESVAIGDGIATGWLIELVKARALSAALSVPHRTDDDLSPDAAAFDEISRKLDAVSFRMYTGQARVADLVERNQLMLQRASLLESIRIRDPRWRGVTEPVSLDVDAVHQWALTQNCRVLLLYSRAERITSVLLGDENPMVGEVMCSESTVAALEEYAQNLRLTQFDPFLLDISARRGLTVDALVPVELARKAAEGDSLILVPHASLHLLPWSTLLLEGRRLFEATAVAVLPNLAILATMAGEFSTSPSINLIGDPDYSNLTKYPPLPQAGPEIADLMRLYEPTGVLAPPLTRAAATDQAVLKRFNPPRASEAILHLVAHGRLDSEDPLSSGVVLTGSTLDAGEILLRRCGYSEVALSACSTGWRPLAVGGRVLVGDDALGLTASFIEAGARFLLVSIPKAEDTAARKFYVTWHRYRHSGLMPLQAYRATQLALARDEPDGIHTWAGITAYGYSEEKRVP